jgi:hypothetical protein
MNMIFILQKCCGMMDKEIAPLTYVLDVHVPHLPPHNISVKIVWIRSYTVVPVSSRTTYGCLPPVRTGYAGKGQYVSRYVVQKKTPAQHNAATDEKNSRFFICGAVRLVFPCVVFMIQHIGA